MHHTQISTPIGQLTLVASATALTNIFFADDPLLMRTASLREQTMRGPASIHLETPILRDTAQQLHEYFAGTRQHFTIPLGPHGTDFLKQTWHTMTQQVPFGKAITYGALADLVGKPRAARAIGMANNRNPIPIIIPCHRVVGANGNLTGFRGGLGIKQWLLNHESSR